MPASFTQLSQNTGLQYGFFPIMYANQWRHELKHKLQLIVTLHPLYRKSDVKYNGSYNVILVPEFDKLLLMSSPL